MKDVARIRWGREQMHSFLVILQIIIFLGTLGFVLVILREKNNELVKIMLCIAYSEIMMNAGYLIELNAKQRKVLWQQ